MATDSKPYVSPDGVLLPDLDTYVTGTGQILRAVHPPELCDGRPCVIHSQTEHSMRDFPTHFRSDTFLMERICPHGVGHPDPDDLAYQMLIGNATKSIHGCDGCCSRDLEACPKCKGYDEGECTCTDLVKQRREARGR